jgi:hypothetical protein
MVVVLYGFDIFLRSRGEQRKGRHRFIGVSVAILVMSCIDGTLDISAVFRMLCGGKLSGRPYLQADDLARVSHRTLNLVGDVALEITIIMSNTLMVSILNLVYTAINSICCRFCSFGDAWCCGIIEKALSCFRPLPA